jgi:5'-nucleotidase
MFNSIRSHQLDISRAAFVTGRDPFRYLEAFDAALFLSANPEDVRKAIMAGAPAGRPLVAVLDAARSRLTAVRAHLAEPIGEYVPILAQKLTQARQPIACANG